MTREFYRNQPKTQNNNIYLPKEKQRTESVYVRGMTYGDVWKVGHSGVIGYMNALSHLLDYCRTFPNSKSTVDTFVASEVYLSRVKRFLSKKMKIEWNSILTIEYLESLNCWATLKDMNAVVPYHAQKYSQIIYNASTDSTFIPQHMTYLLRHPLL